jgi:hypothetical protein
MSLHSNIITGEGMTQDEIIKALRQVVEENTHYTTWTVSTPHLVLLVNLAIEQERDRIKQANAPEIERINAHIKELEDAVLAEREACAKVCDDHFGWTPRMIGETIRARGQA